MLEELNFKKGIETQQIHEDHIESEKNDENKSRNNEIDEKIQDTVQQQWFLNLEELDLEETLSSEGFVLIEEPQVKEEDEKTQRVAKQQFSPVEQEKESEVDRFQYDEMLVNMGKLSTKGFKLNEESKEERIKRLETELKNRIQSETDKLNNLVTQVQNNKAFNDFIYSKTGNVNDVRKELKDIPSKIEALETQLSLLTAQESTIKDFSHDAKAELSLLSKQAHDLINKAKNLGAKVKVEEERRNEEKSKIANQEREELLQALKDAGSNKRKAIKQYLIQVQEHLKDSGFSGRELLTQFLKTVWEAGQLGLGTKELRKLEKKYGRNGQRLTLDNLNKFLLTVPIFKGLDSLQVRDSICKIGKRIKNKVYSEYGLGDKFNELKKTIKKIKKTPHLFANPESIGSLTIHGTEEKKVLFYLNRRGKMRVMLLDKEIGRGGFGIVSRLINLSSGKVKVLKKIDQSEATNESPLNQLKNERKKLVQIHQHYSKEYGYSVPGIQHKPNEIRNLGNGEVGYIMKVYEGGDYSRYIENSSGFILEDRLSESHQLLTGLTLLHKLDIMHGDIKGSNILMTKDNKGKELVDIADFGGVSSREDIDPGNIVKSLEDLKAKPRSNDYAPDHDFDLLSLAQKEGDVERFINLEKKRDVFAMGAVLYKAFVGKTAYPLDAGTGHPVLKEDNSTLNREDLKNVRTKDGKEIPEQLQELIFLMLDWDPNKRPTAETALNIFLAIRDQKF